MKLKPLGDHVIIEPMAQEEKTKFGIVLPQTVDKEKSQEGVVIAAGPGKLGSDGKRLLMSVKKGDRVLFAKYSPQEIKIKDKEYLIVKEEDVIAIIEK
ncbi:MAG: 10 kDa chaperonin [Parcubacteria group bacterium GW2011_GWD2_38_12]|nr:MAG: 10 kDa chaperonin [Parcubacteria group bacterium GW2011_GWC2_36_17]KKQ38414.1 MAG: 10 kDa chaperonin [Candidatus Moranbacteria bacterium GW2011_GWF2_37_7]KKQ43690.1 MAG: 10 kDa chaperonin [Parcubacteria group bacterium GW2011_GWE2_37_8]KKQ52624.1 MAG: 10 kDa chaperonin [Parcubacteria group bacterium GW2011_GWD2_38_12]KKQ58856.1 MAG: 10 kDa chaperonin [Parcubacteria group bacterium GW2011_GWC1_38_17]KKQ59577.1 MAG: 10 kDa chaperonin [Parcubacteria group bacterium GW2011_GWD1_38_16]